MPARRTGRVTLAAMAALLIGATGALAAPPPPAGLTGIALDSSVSLAWQASPGATGYQVLRGGTVIASPAGTTYADASAVNGTTHTYTVRAVDGTGASVDSPVARVQPRNRVCSESANAIAAENCFPGTDEWETTQPESFADGGLEGFPTAQSIDAGESVGLKVRADPAASYQVEIYRTGWYQGSQGRLISVIPGQTSPAQPPCETDPAGTGLVDCSTWARTQTITTSSDWPSGVYLLRFVLEGASFPNTDNEALLVVRNDAGNSQLLYQVPTTTFQAYNDYGGKSLYSFNSVAPTTVSGENRAVKVSFDRPYLQPDEGAGAQNWYTRTDLPAVGWLERQGYDISYWADDDLHRLGGTLARSHRALLFGAHDEYWSQEMFDAAVAARDGGTSLLFLGANAAYWKVRFESPSAFRQDRTLVTYKTAQSGGPDPSGISTSTWRDPDGPNRPENELIGQMYFGDNDFNYFPLRVSAAEGDDPVWRHTALAGLAPGGFADIGSDLVGWEWDRRVANGREPAGVRTVASSPVTGQILTDAGRVYAPGSGVANATIYDTACSTVFATGTNHWARGLGENVHNAGDEDPRIQQATLNVLGDMSASPATPQPGLIADPPVAPRACAPGSSPAPSDTGASAAPATPAPSRVTMGGTSASRRLSVRVRRTSLPRALRRGLVLRAFAPGAGTLRATAKHGRKAVGSGRTRARRATTYSIVVRFTRSARRTLARKRKVSLSVRVTYTPRQGKATARTLRVTLKR